MLLPKDLLDFFHRWGELRKLAMDLQVGEPLTEEQAVVIHWLVLLADRTTEHDFETNDEAKK